MEILNKIVAYWYDCIKNEDILEKGIPLQVRTKAVLYPFDNDPFIFSKKDEKVLISKNERLTKFSEYCSTLAYDIFYGYHIQLTSATE